MAGTRYVHTEHANLGSPRAPASSQIRPVGKTATVSATATGVVFTLARLLGSASQLALINGTSANLKLDAATGSISATAALGDGVIQKALVRESDGEVAVEYPVTLTGVASVVAPAPAPAPTQAPAPTPTPTPTVSISAAQSKNEGNSGTTFFVYTVTRSSAIGAASVPWSFSANTTSANDFVGGTYPQGGTVELADGVASGTFSVGVNGDAAVETDEAFGVSIATPAGYAAGTAMSATGTILNDDVAPVLALSSVAPSVAANAAAGTLISNIANVPAGVTPTVTPNDGRLVIAGNASTGWKVVVGLSAMSAGTIDFAAAAAGATGANGILTVTAAPVTPTVTLSGAQSKSEGNSGATVFTYTVSRSSTSGAINVPWSFTAGGTSASDFTSGSLPTGGTVAMADGVATGTFSISVNGDTFVEGDETFTVLLSTPSGYVAGASMSATGTILNDDSSSVMPLRTIAVQNRVHTGKEGRTGMDRCIVRWPIVIGTDASEAVIWMSNWLHLPPNVNPGNTLEVLDMSLSRSTDSTAVPVTFAGARNRLMADGELEVLSDPLLPSAFGQGKFTTGDVYWVKARLAVPATGNVIPSSQRSSGQFSGSYVGFYNSANSVPSATDANGPYTVTGTGFDPRSNGWCPMLLGRPLVDGPSFLGIGDSIMEITGDSGADTNKEYGLAFFQRGMHDASLARTNLRPSILCARVGIAASAVSVSANWNVLTKYCRYAVEELGTNDMGGTVSSIQANLSSIWTVLRNAGLKIYRTNFIARSTSTNGWADKAGQTPNNGWGAGETRDQLISWFDTKVADGTLAGVIDTLSAGSDPTDNHYFVSTGVASATTSDGTHPRDAVHEAMAAKVRAVIQPLQ